VCCHADCKGVRDTHACAHAHARRSCARRRCSARSTRRRRRAQRRRWTSECSQPGRVGAQPCHAPLLPAACCMCLSCNLRGGQRHAVSSCTVAAPRSALPLCIVAPDERTPAPRCVAWPPLSTQPAGRSASRASGGSSARRSLWRAPRAGRGARRRRRVGASARRGCQAAAVHACASAACTGVCVCACRDQVHTL
jgi:hypothetical protein